jgi:hypothetical protein
MRLAALAVLSLCAPALSASAAPAGGPINLSVTCKAQPKGTSANITGFVVKGATKDWQKGAPLSGHVASFEITENGKVVARGKNLPVTGRQEMSAKGAYYDLYVNVPGKGSTGVNITPQGNVEVSTGKGAAFKLYKTNCTEKG